MELPKNRLRRILVNPPEGPIDIHKELPESFRRRRDLLINELPLAEEGLDLEEYVNFFSEFGLQTVPIHVFDKNDPNALSVLEKNRRAFGREQISEEIYGKVFPHLHLGLVARDRALELTNGINTTEMVIAHEAAHSTGLTGDNFRLFFMQYGETHAGYVSRRGFNIEGKNCFLEEAFAAFMSKKFLEKKYANNPKRLLTDRNLATQFQDFSSIQVEFTNGTRGPLSPLYIVNTAQGEAKVPETHFAGQALDLLCDVDPQLFEVMIEARKTPQGIREFYHRLKRIIPNSTALVRDLPRSDLEKGYHSIVNELQKTV